MGPVTDFSTKQKDGELFVPRIKPLRWIPEEEIALYAKLKKLDFYPRHCPWRGGMRLEVKHFLDEMEKKHAGIKFGVLKTFDRLVPSLRNIVEYPESKIMRCKT